MVVIWQTLSSQTSKDNSDVGRITNVLAMSQHSQVAARTEHRGTNRSAGTATVTISTTPGTVTLAASSRTYRLQACRPDLQHPTYINSCIPQLPHQTSGIYTPPPFFNHTAATQTDYQNSLRRPRFPMLCSCHLELSELMTSNRKDHSVTLRCSIDWRTMTSKAITAQFPCSFYMSERFRKMIRWDYKNQEQLTSVKLCLCIAPCFSLSWPSRIMVDNNGKLDVSGVSMMSSCLANSRRFDCSFSAG